MSSDMFLKLTDMEGESLDHKHGQEIDVLAWSWGMSQSGTTHLGPGAGSGKVSVQDVSVTKYVDSASHSLVQFCMNGKHFAEGMLTVRKAGGENPLEYVKIKMEDVIVTSISTGGSGGEDRLTENITLNFGKVTFTYTPQTADGSGDAEKEYGYNIPANEPL